MKTAEQTIRDTAFPSGITDEKWQEFKHNHEGKNWVGFAIKAMEEYRKQGNYFSPDEIRKVQELAYEAGFWGAMAEKG